MSGRKISLRSGAEAELERDMWELPVDRRLALGSAHIPIPDSESAVVPNKEEAQSCLEIGWRQANFTIR